MGPRTNLLTATFKGLTCDKPDGTQEEWQTSGIGVDHVMLRNDPQALLHLECFEFDLHLNTPGALGLTSF